MVALRISPPNDEPLVYICPKPLVTGEDDYRIVIEPQDINLIYPDEIEQIPFIWATLMWGGRRDISLIKYFKKYQNIAALSNQNIAIYSQGIKKGNEQAKKTKYEPLKDRHILKSDNFPDDTFVYIRTDLLPINKEIYAERPRKEKHEAFNEPQLIIKQSWVTHKGRFTAAIAEFDPEINQGILCKESFMSIHVSRNNFAWLEAAWLSYNSKVAVYYLFLLSGRFASFIHEIKPNELVSVPVPNAIPNLLLDINNFDTIDDCVRQLFALKDSEWVLIEDLFNFTLPDFKGNDSSPGKKETQRQNESQLTEYCKYFLQVIKAGFGQEKKACSTIFHEQESYHLPVRLVAIYLNHYVDEEIMLETIDSQLLLRRLNRLNQLFITQENSNEGEIFYQRVARIYDSTFLNGVQVPTVYLV